MRAAPVREGCIDCSAVQKARFTPNLCKFCTKRAKMREITAIYHDGRSRICTLSKYNAFCQGFLICFDSFLQNPYQPACQEMRSIRLPRESYISVTIKLAFYLHWAAASQRPSRRVPIPGNGQGSVLYNIEMSGLRGAPTQRLLPRSSQRFARILRTRPADMGARQNGGKFLATSRQLCRGPQLATLVCPNLAHTPPK